MKTELQHLHKDIEEIKKSLNFIKTILAEEYELSGEAKKQIVIARNTPVSDYIDHEEVKRRLLK